MPKVATGTRVEKQVYDRLERLAKVDRRSIANIVEICIEKFLPKLEEEILDRQSSVYREEPVPYKTAAPVSSGKHPKKVA
jgi:hypothetical protein